MITFLQDSTSTVAPETPAIGLEEFIDFNLTNPIDIPLGNFVLNLFLTILLTVATSFLYARYGDSLSNRKSFANNYPLIGIATFLIISIIKSSLALSLGLVGALSIVRFRSAIKEPEELAYIFFTIAIALGFGANQIYVTIIGFFVFAAFIIIKKTKGKKQRYDLVKFIIIESKEDVDIVTNILKPNVENLSLKRLETNDGLNEYIFNAEITSFETLTILRKGILEKDPKAKFVLMDQSGLNNI
ncbi:MAG: DUF4956 domain-containing protein [Winogradskyella sp.]|uniref:DUF4956 domain-containing protein n=1 Tax=Winogradskyella sp. TaxID=1883156 RepID=UPI00385A4DA0